MKRFAELLAAEIAKSSNKNSTSNNTRGLDFTDLEIKATIKVAELKEKLK